MPKKAKSVKKAKNKNTIARLEQQLSRLEQQDISLSKQEIDEQHQSQLQLFKYNGTVLSLQSRTLLTKQYHCNHKKGGMITGTGNNISFPTKGVGGVYAVLKHQMSNGDIWVGCLRCGKWWKPPVKSQFPGDYEFYMAVKEYNDAVNFDTNNTMSSSVQFNFSAFASEKLRESLVST